MLCGTLMLLSISSGKKRILRLLKAQKVHIVRRALQRYWPTQVASLQHQRNCPTLVFLIHLPILPFTLFMS